MESNMVFYDREVVNRKDLIQIHSLADTFYDVHGNESAEIFNEINKEDPYVFQDYGVVSTKRAKVLASALSVIPFVKKMESDAEAGKDSVESDVRRIYDRLKLIDSKRNVRDADISFSNIYLNKIMASSNEDISRMGYIIESEEADQYVTSLREVQQERQTTSLSNHFDHVKKIDKDVLGDGSHGRGGYDADPFNFFPPEDDRLRDAAEKWMDVYQISKGCDRAEAEKALGESLEYYSNEDKSNDASSMYDHLETDASVRFGEMMRTASYSEYQRIMSDPDMIDFNADFQTKFPDYAKSIQNERLLSDLDTKRKLKNASQRYSIAKNAVEYASSMNDGGYDLGVDR